MSLLSVLSKVFEKKLFSNIFIIHLRDDFVLTEKQSGVIPGNSTVTQLVDLQYQFGKALNEKKGVIIVF